MNVTGLVNNDVSKLLGECQKDLDLIPQVIAYLEELYLRRQEDEEKILQALQILNDVKIRSSTEDISSLILLANEDEW
jgi:hypothetical protein